MLTINVEIQDRQINGQTEKIKHTEFVQGSIHKVYVKFFDGQARLIAVRLPYLGRQNSWIVIGKCKTEIPIKKGLASPSIKETQFPLTLPWASTVHKVQGLSLEQGSNYPINDKADIIPSNPQTNSILQVNSIPQADSIQQTNSMNSIPY